MRYAAIVFALITIITAVESSMAQTAPSGSSPMTSTADGTFRMKYPSPQDPKLKLYAADVKGPAEACFGNRSIGLKRGIDQDKVIWDWRKTNDGYDLTWAPKVENKDSCQVLFASRDGRIDSADFVVWRRNVGTRTAGANMLMSDGSVRFISYSVDVSRRPSFTSFNFLKKSERVSKPSSH